MPEDKRQRCPKGEHYDKKTKKCVKVKKSPPKKESPKKNNTKKVSPKKSPKKNNTKKVSPNKKNTKSRNIPKLAVLKSTISDYEYKYFKVALGRIEKVNKEKGYVKEENYRPITFYKLHQIMNILEKEIDNINETHCSGGPKHDEFCFGFDTSEKIIKQLNVYINYFKHCADKSGRVDEEDYIALYK